MHPTYIDLVGADPHPGDELSFVKRGRDEAEIRRMERAFVGMIDHEHVAWANTRRIRAIGNDVLDHLRNRSRVIKHGFAEGDDLTMNAEDTGVEVGSIIDQRGARDRRERRCLLFADRDETMMHDLESDRIRSEE